MLKSVLFFIFSLFSQLSAGDFGDWHKAFFGKLSRDQKAEVITAIKDKISNLKKPDLESNFKFEKLSSDAKDVFTTLTIRLELKQINIETDKSKLIEMYTRCLDLCNSKSNEDDSKADIQDRNIIEDLEIEF